MRAALLALAGAVVSVLAFPPFGPGWLIVLGVALFLTGVRLSGDRREGLVTGAVYGLIFFGGLIWWLSELELIALILVPVQAAFFAAYGWWLSRYNTRPQNTWLVLAVGGWALMESIRYRFPFGGFEWGGAGYAMSDNLFTRLEASLIGVSGLTVIVVLIAALIASAITRRTGLLPALTVAVVFFGVSAVHAGLLGQQDVELGVTIVQGSTPCPFEHCSPDERLRTYEQHLDLTRSLPPGDALVVWSEGSTGSTNADPVLNPEIGKAIGEEAKRMGAAMLVGSDRPVSATEWINANVVFDSTGEIVGEYRKQHPVPFGEYIPLRPLFEWIPALDRVPRDMIPGDGPVVFDVGGVSLGSVISFEGAFARYALGHRRAGADVLVVATNEASYGLTPASEQFIGMTRMRAVEHGVPVVHAAVTGKSTVIDSRGELSPTTELGAQEILSEGIAPGRARTLYSYIGDLVLYLAAAGGVVMWWRARSLVGSSPRSFEEE